MTPSAHPPSSESPPLMDVSQCARELVHLPGSIQPHGVLLVLDPLDLKITGVSENAESLLSKPAETLLGQRIAAIGAAGSGQELLESLRREDFEERNPFSLTLANGGRVEVIAHRHDARVIVECEAEDSASEFQPSYVHNRVRRSLARLRARESLRDLLSCTAREVRQLTGFDRILIYAFTPDWSGEVFAEDCGDGRPRYLGLRFPASDIPSQARALYASCRLRSVPTSTYTPARILGLADQRPLDLTHASLRSISPVHLEYMRNMGVTASLGISLMREDRLWGLITCNHESGARFIPYEARMACSLLGEVVSSLISKKEGVAAAEERARFLGTEARLLSSVAQDADVPRGLTEHSPSVLDVTDSAGAALYYNNEFHCVGRTPEGPALVELMLWIAAQQAKTLVIESLPERYAPALSWKELGCGLLATCIACTDSRVVTQKNWLLWFRPEVVQTVSWGGDPNKPVALGPHERLHPRNSFEQWKEEVHLQSVRFEPGQVAAAESLALALSDAILEIEASRQIRAHALLLDTSNRELHRQVEENLRVNLVLAARSEQLRQREASLQLVLDATGDGLISVALDGKLLAERSRAFDEWFPGLSDEALIWDVLFADDEPQSQEFRLHWEQLTEQILPSELCVAQMVSELTLREHCFEIGYKEVREGATLSSVLMTFEDVTERVAARRIASEAAEAQGILLSVVRDARGFGRTLAELKSLSNAAKNAPSTASARQALHTLKGNAATLGLTTLAKRCHEVEDRLAEREEAEAVSAGDLGAVDHELSRVVARVQELAGDRAFERVEIRPDDLASAIHSLEQGDAAAALGELRRWTLEPALGQLCKLAGRARSLARELGKNVDVVVADGAVRVDPDAFEPLWGALTHAISNAIDHGIETENVRLARGKPARGRIVLSAEDAGDGWLVLEVADDGAGVDLEAMRGAAQRRGLPCSTRRELIDALFADALSTRSEVTATSGRGVGLSALRATCIRLGGTVDLDTEDGGGTKLRLRIPALLQRARASAPHDQPSQ